MLLAAPYLTAGLVGKQSGGQASCRRCHRAAGFGRGSLRPAAARLRTTRLPRHCGGGSYLASHVASHVDEHIRARMQGVVTPERFRQVEHPHAFS